MSLYLGIFTVMANPYGGNPYGRLLNRELQIMTRPSAHLPEYYPVGTSYVVEGRNDARGVLKVSARYVMLPGGRRIDLPLKAGPSPLTPRQRLLARSRSASRGSARKRARPEHRIGA